MSAIVNSLFNVCRAVFVTFPSACFARISTIAHAAFYRGFPRNHTRQIEEDTALAIALQFGEEDNADRTSLRRRSGLSVISATQSSNTLVRAAVPQTELALASALAASMEYETMGASSRVAPLRSVVPDTENDAAFARALAETLDYDDALAASLAISSAARVCLPAVGRPAESHSQALLEADRALALRLAGEERQGAQNPRSSSRSLSVSADLAYARAITASREEWMADAYVPQVGERAQLSVSIGIPNNLEDVLVANLRGRYPNQIVPPNVNIATRNQCRALVQHSGYRSWQPISGDGNCFYTSFAVDIFEGFRNLDRQQKEHILQQFQNCSVSREVKGPVVSALRNVSNGIRFPVEDDNLMLQVVQCLRNIGADYLAGNQTDIGVAGTIRTILGPEAIRGVVATMRRMGEDTDNWAIQAVVAALGHPIRIITIDGTTDRPNFYDIDILGAEHSQNWACNAPPMNDRARALLHHSGHYCVLHR